MLFPTPIAVRGDAGAAHWNVVYRYSSKAETMLDIYGILVIRFDESGLCVEHKEWFVTRELPGSEQ